MAEPTDTELLNRLEKFGFDVTIRGRATLGPSGPVFFAIESDGRMLATGHASLRGALAHALGVLEYESGKRTTSAATASGRELPNSASTPETVEAAGPGQERHQAQDQQRAGSQDGCGEAANGGDARGASGGCARPAVALTDEDIAAIAERLEATDPNSSFWREFARAVEAHIRVSDGVQPCDKVQLPEKARAGIEVLHRVVESLLTTSRYVDEEGEATQALADLSDCIADPPFRLAGNAGVGGTKS